jgi:hypothetical protein
MSSGRGTRVAIRVVPRAIHGAFDRATPDVSAIDSDGWVRSNILLDWLAE